MIAKSGGRFSDKIMRRPDIRWLGKNEAAPGRCGGDNPELLTINRVSDVPDVRQNDARTFRESQTNFRKPANFR
jgi:hypothetical protein